MINVLELGSIPYAEALDLQRVLVERRKAGAIADVLLLLEHPPVVTLGRNAKEKNVIASRELLAARGVERFECDRGGDVTYHGPGQLVGYPILDLRRHGGDVLAYLRRLEDTLIESLQGLGVEADRVAGYTGVWTGAGKIAAIGVKLTETVVSHGFALNLSTDLDYFGGIVPCGIEDKEVTSVAALRGIAPSVELAASDWAEVFASSFDAVLEEQAEELISRI